MSSSIDLWSKRIYDIINKGEKYSTILHKIKNIKDISVRVKLSITKNIITLTIRHDHLTGKFCFDHYKMFLYDINLNEKNELQEEIKNGLVVINKIMSSLEFDKLYGSYYYGDREKEKINNKLNDIVYTSEIYGELVDIKNIECCVCTELTLTETVCNHPLCLVCWDKIINNGNKLKRICPLCREYKMYEINNMY
jgi:hypothetical protein